MHPHTAASHHTTTQMTTPSAFWLLATVVDTPDYSTPSTREVPRATRCNHAHAMPEVSRALTPGEVVGEPTKN